MRTSDNLRTTTQVFADVRDMDLPDRVVWSKVTETVTRLNELVVVLDMRARFNEKYLQRWVCCGETSCGYATSGSG